MSPQTGSCRYTHTHLNWFVGTLVFNTFSMVGLFIFFIFSTFSIADIQDYFEFIIRKYETLTENPQVQIYLNKIKNRIVFKIKTGYKLELLTPETMKLLGITKKDVDQIKIVKISQN